MMGRLMGISYKST